MMCPGIGFNYYIICSKQFHLKLYLLVVNLLVRLMSSGATAEVMVAVKLGPIATTSN